MPEEEFQRLCRQAKAAGPAAQRPRKARMTLKQMDSWISDHWRQVIAKAKHNTKQLTGREIL